ncbi:MAG: hypothetical protein F4201_00825 [Nitrospira sp. SB0677_bin_15]|nr:hypothetical protein [Nitrospira sp. SB0677_bin_15]
MMQKSIMWLKEHIALLASLVTVMAVMGSGLFVFVTDRVTAQINEQVMPSLITNRNDIHTVKKDIKEIKGEIRDIREDIKTLDKKVSDNGANLSWIRGYLEREHRKKNNQALHTAP